MAVGYVAVEHVYGLLPRKALPTTQTPSPSRQRVDPPKPAAERVIAAPKPAASPTSSAWPEDRQWGAVDGWSVFETGQTACLARKSFPDDVSLVLGRVKGSGDFILGMAGNLPGSEDRTLSLVFDGTRKRQPYFQRNAGILVGRYGANAGLAQEISRSGGFHVAGEKRRTATLPLAGTRAALAVIQDCLDAMVPNDSAAATRASPFPDSSLCADRPSNGRLLTTRGGLKGQGNKLKVRNSTEGDAIVKVRNAKTGKLSFSFFVHDGDEAEIRGLSDGTYRLQFAYGDTLKENCSEFTNPRASEFDKSVTFTTRVTRTNKQILTQTTEFTVTLYAVTGGNAPTSKISQQDFLAE